MKDVKVIGIDTDSCGFHCVLIGVSIEKVKNREFRSSELEMNKFLRWYQSEETPIIAIEGKSGLNFALENFLRKNNIQFYSFTATQVFNARKAFIGSHKTNSKDAEAVASLALDCYLKGTLEQYKQIWYADDDLRDLTRFYDSTVKQRVSEVNRLWKLIRYSSQSLYLTLNGKADKENSDQLLLRKGIATLISKEPDICKWSRFKVNELMDILKITNTKHDWSKLLKKASRETTEIKPYLKMILKATADRFLLLLEQQKNAKKALDNYNEDKRVNALKSIKGIGPICATGIVAEIIDIRRFANNDKLASYCGIGRRSHMTGENNQERRISLYNRRLKYFFITDAKNYVLYNPDKHLSGYYRNLLKRGMKVMEARKRVARSLIRIIFRILKECTPEEEIRTEGVANETCHKGKIPSNTHLSSIYNHNQEKGKSNVKKSNSA